ncbi:hypothetical protein ACHAXM_005760 [Skeletonema potamos]|jgi:hypothetical protein
MEFTKMVRIQPPRSGQKSAALFTKFALFVIVSQLPLYLFLFRSRQSLTEPVGVDVQTMALVTNDVGAAPKKIVVLGEHSSGSGYVSGVLKKAFGDDVAMMHETPHRHDILQQTELDDIAARKDILWIMVVRSPCEWADAMIDVKKKICAETQSTSKQCSVESKRDYYSTEWKEEPQDEKNVERIIPSTVQGAEHPDIFSMRVTKLFIMKQIMEANARHVKIVQFNEFERNPDALVKDLEKEYLFQRTDSSVYPASTNPHGITCMGPEEWEVAQQKIDWTLEGYFGYTKWDCRLCRENVSAGSNPSIIYLLGERNSGTTFVSDTLAKAFDPPNKLGNKAEVFSADIPVVQYKHMFRHDLLNATELAEIKRRDDILWVMVVRSPCDWAEAMMRKPYHFCPPKHPERCGPGTDTLWTNHNNLAGVQLVDFFTTVEWSDWAESTHFMRNEAFENGKVKAVDPYSISKPGVNYTYPNVFALRRQKLKLMKQIFEVAPDNVKFVRLNEFERGPGLFIDNLVKEFDLKVKTEYTKPPPSIYSHTTTCLTPNEWTAAQNEIDWRLEAEFGFSPHDCRMCYGYNRSTRLYRRVMDQRKIGKKIQPERFGSKAGKE